MRLGVRPPGVKESWEKCGVRVQARILAFDQLCEYDAMEKQVASVRGTL